MKWQFQFDLEAIRPKMKEAVGRVFSILGELWAKVSSVQLDLFLFHYTEKNYMLICCTIKVLLAQVYESPLLCSNNVTNKLYGSSETTVLSRILCVCCIHLRTNVTEVLKPLLKLVHMTSLIGQTY